MRKDDGIDHAFKEGFALRFRRAMGAKDITPQILSSRAGIGYQTVLSLRKGKHVPSGYALARICPVLGVTSDYLLGIGAKGAR